MSLIFGPVTATAMDALNLQGLVTAPKPQYACPSLPRDLTAVGDENLMVLYSELTAYADFISIQVSCAQVDERVIEKNLSSLELRKMLGSEGKSENRVTFARAQVSIDPDVVALKNTLEEIHAYRKLIEAMRDNIERDSSLVSRELTRRTSGAARSSRWAP